MNVWKCILFPCLAVGVLACATSPPSVPDRLAIHSPSAHPATASPGVDATEARSGESGEEAPVLTLGSAVERALLNNPSLRAEYARFEAMLLDVSQASSLADPMAMVSQKDAFRGPGEERENMLTLSQTFPWFGKRDLRGRVARAEAFEVLEEYRLSALDVRRDVSRAWHMLRFEEANRELTLQDSDVLNQTLEATMSLYESGRADRGSLLRVQTEMARVDSDLPGIDSSIEAQRRELVRLMGTPQAAFTASDEDADVELATVPDLETLIAEAITHRPELEQYRRREEAADLAGRLARADYYPDFTVGVDLFAMGDRGSEFYTPDSDGRTDSIRASVGINIPIPNARRRAAVDQARHRVDEASQRRESAADKILEEIHATSARLSGLEQQHTLFRDSILPLARDAYDAADAAYRSGQTTFVDLIDVQRTLIAARRDMLRIERDYNLSLADLERAMGMPLDLVHIDEEAQP
jgi:outer membrane protein, heavy metal efflux system